MNETYVRILQMIDKQPAATRDLAKRALTWVVAAARPLKPTELAIAVEMTPRPEELDLVGKYLPKTVIDACRGFVTVQSDEVRLVHNTVKESLTSQLISDLQPSRLNQNYRVVLEEAHHQLAHDFIRYAIYLRYVHTNYDLLRLVDYAYHFLITTPVHLTS